MCDITYSSTHQRSLTPILEKPCHPTRCFSEGKFEGKASSSQPTPKLFQLLHKDFFFYLIT